MAKISQKKLALVHIVKKELGLTDEEYRLILKKITGVTSAKDIDDAMFRKLINFLVRSKHYKLNVGGFTLKQKMFIQSMVRQLEWSPEHFENFLRKYYNRSRLETLSRSEASKVIESLKNILKHDKL